MHLKIVSLISEEQLSSGNVPEKETAKSLDVTNRGN
jgi:hypothetical protein